MSIFNIFNFKSKKVRFRARMSTNDYTSAHNFLLEHEMEHPEADGWKQVKSGIDEHLDNVLRYEAVCEYHQKVRR